MSVSPASARMIAQTPPPEPQDTYDVQPGESLEQIAAEHGTTVDALLERNPQIRNPDLLYSGDRLSLPPRSTQGEQIGSDIDTRFGTSNDEFTVEGQAGQNGGSVLVNPGDGAVGVEVNREHIPGAPEDPGATTPRVGGEFQATSRAAVTEYHANDDGTTTYKLEVEVGSGFEASGQAGRGQLEGSYAVDGGFRGFYEVTLPTNANRDASREAAIRINPFNPASIPEGATVTLHGAAYVNTELSVAFRHLGTVTNVTESGGVAIAVERTGEDTVRATAGPTQAVEAYSGVGVSFEQAQLMFGRQDNVGAATLRSAEFDLSTAAGREGYANFLRTGQASEGPGVDDVVTIEKLDYQSQTRIEAQLGPFGASIGGAENVGGLVRTTYADGSVAVTTDLQYAGNVPMSISQRFDAAGNEIVSERRYSYTIETGDSGAAQFLNVAATGSFEAADSGPVQDGQSVTVTFNEAGMQQLVAHTQALAAHSPTASEANLLGYTQPDGTRPTPSAFDFAVSLGRNLNSSDYGFSSKLFNIASGSDAGGFSDAAATRLPMSIEVAP